ncbi:MAG TPA: LysM domain-containing protein [Gemmatimonadales bacterium]|jgi:hypothetical protein|nr:LysM domain-containing protein [Gemmatimonadales bacterium]
MARLPIGRLGLVLLGLAGGTQVLAAQNAKPETHTVKPGDTLWQLAGTYLGDPFLWPELYRINTSVVEDPHWIYPGEVLRLMASADVTAVPTTDTPPPAPVAVNEAAGPVSSAAPSMPPDTLGPRGEEWKKYFANRDDAMRQAISGYGEMEYRPLRRGEFYSSGFLTEGRDMPFGRLVGPVEPSQIGAAATTPTVLLSNRVYLTPPKGAAYRVGDSLLVADLGGEVGNQGRMVIPSGMLQVTEVAPGRTVARVIEMYHEMAAGQVVLPLEPFTPGVTRQAVPVTDGVQAHVLGGPLRQVLRGPQDVLFLDKGRQDGVAAGDIFEIRRSEKRRSDGVVTAPDVLAMVQVVHVGERTATVRILTLTAPVIANGSESRQVGRLPS